MSRGKYFQEGDIQSAVQLEDFLAGRGIPPNYCVTVIGEAGKKLRYEIRLASQVEWDDVKGDYVSVYPDEESELLW